MLGLSTLILFIFSILAKNLNALRMMSRTVTKVAVKAKTEYLNEHRSTYNPSSPLCLKVLSWNIDGLEQDSGYRARFLSVIANIRACGADVVCIQEMVDNFRLQLHTDLGSIYNIADDLPRTEAHYYTVTLLKKDSVRIIAGGTRSNFEGGARSEMARDVLSITIAKFGYDCNAVGVIESVPVRIVTSHLESGAEKSQPRSSAIRRQQYIQILRILEVPGPGMHAGIACGDFNLRVAEAEDGRKETNSSALDTYDVSGAKEHVSLRTTWRRAMDNVSVRVTVTSLRVMLYTNESF